MYGNELRVVADKLSKQRDVSSAKKWLVIECSKVVLGEMGQVCDYSAFSAFLFLRVVGIVRYYWICSM
jgi:hypothetical protein